MEAVSLAVVCRFLFQVSLPDSLANLIVWRLVLSPVAVDQFDFDLTLTSTVYEADATTLCSLSQTAQLQCKALI